VIPTQQVVQYTAQARLRRLTLIAFPPPPHVENRVGVLRDDGTSFGYEKGVSTAGRSSEHRRADEGRSGIGPVDGSYVPRLVHIQVVSGAAARAPSSTGIGLSGRRTLRGTGVPGSPVWPMNAAEKSVLVTFPDERGAIDVVVQE